MIGKAAIALACSLASLGCDSQPTMTSEATSQLALVADEDLRLGTLWAGTRQSKRVRLQNLSDKPITIREFRSSCVCTGVSPSSLTIGPMEIASIEVAVDLTAKIDGPQARTLELDVMPVIADAAPLIPLRVTGRVDELLRLSQSAVWFDQPVSSAEQTITISSLAKLEKLSVSGCESFVSTKLTRNGDLDYVLSIKPRDDIELGKLFNGRIVFDVTLKNGEQVTIDGLKCAGRCPMEVEATPRSIQLGFVEVGSTISRRIALRSSADGNSSIKIVECHASSENVHVEFDSIETPRPVLVVSCNAATKGRGSSMLKIDVDVASVRHSIEVPITFVGMGSKNSNPGSITHPSTHSR